MFDLSFDWQDLMIRVVRFAGENPWQFLYYILLGLSPLFALSAFLSYKLVQEIDKKDKDTKKRQQKEVNKIKSRKTKKE